MWLIPNGRFETNTFSVFVVWHQSRAYVNRIDSLTVNTTPRTHTRTRTRKKTNDANKYTHTVSPSPSTVILITLRSYVPTAKNLTIWWEIKYKSWIRFLYCRPLGMWIVNGIVCSIAFSRPWQTYQFSLFWRTTYTSRWIFIPFYRRRWRCRHRTKYM